jgi:nitroreductase
MDVIEALRTMLAVREYDDRPVPDDVVGRIVEAGRLSGSARNAQPWHFVVVREREMLRALGKAMRSGPYIADAAFAVAVAIERKSQFGVTDGSRAAQSMMLAGWAEGVGSNWAGYLVEEAAALLAIPETMQVLCVLPFGYPRNAVRGRKERKPAGEVASRERFGQPFE